MDNERLITGLITLLSIVLFMAIFTLLRTMTSPFIKKFEVMLKAKLERMTHPPDFYRLFFKEQGRDFELYEKRHLFIRNHKQVQQTIIYLKVPTHQGILLRFQNWIGQTEIDHFLGDFRGDSQNPNSESKNNPLLKSSMSEVFYPVGEALPVEKAFLIRSRGQKIMTKVIPSHELGDGLKDFVVSADDVLKAKRFLTNPQVVNILSEYQSSSQSLGAFFPIVIEPEGITLHFSLVERLLNEISRNPRAIHRHIQRLSLLAGEAERWSF